MAFLWGRILGARMFEALVLFGLASECIERMLSTKNIIVQVSSRRIRIE
jgi:hypothetical protein